MKKYFFILFLLSITTAVFAQSDKATDLDTSRMNAILPDFIAELAKTDVKEMGRFADVPAFLKEQLNAFGNFKIAERTDINYQSDCLRYPSAPYRKVEFVGMSDAFLVMSYRLGGLVEQPHILIVKFKDKKIVDIWSGQGFGKSKDKILSQLQKNPFVALNWI
jgi:hypothetical protein